MLHKDELAAFVNKMCHVQKHGGPDDEGTYTNPTFNGMLGHCRLSIIDLSSLAHQPMSYLNDRYTISYNGEIYNYAELKTELKLSGYSFASHSDTEVILAAYDKWGTNSFERLNGMFAIALCDHTKNEVLLARDVSGIKPLYFANTPQLFAFASEVRALKQVPQLQKENSNWQVYLMAYGHLPEPITTLQDVKPLPKGCYLKYNIGSGACTQHTFERLGYFEKISNRKEAVSLVKESLEAAVSRHLISDAPLGVFLSGGLDSSIIAMLAGKKQPQLNTVSIYFDDTRYSEKKFQDELLKKLLCNHQQFLLKEKDFHASLPGIIKAMDLPCCDGINTWYISKYAKQSGLKAVLSGIGGDELFGGYPSFNRMKAASLLSKMPNNFLKASSFSQSKKFRRLCYLSIDGAVGKYLFLRGQFVPSDIARQLGSGEAYVWKVLEETPRLSSIGYLSAGNQASWLETNMYMQNQLLRDADVMSMAHGVEIRVPFLDKEFAKLAFQIHSDIKYSGQHRKQLLIDSFKDILPQQIWDRPKMGFSFPFREWFAHEKYRSAGGGTLAAQHEQFKKGQMHWSQFFTLVLLSLYGNE